VKVGVIVMHGLCEDMRGTVFDMPGSGDPNARAVGGIVVHNET